MTIDEARAERNSRLNASDWMLAEDSPLTPDERSAARQYRQLLRDLTEQPGFPETIAWPAEPERLPAKLTGEAI